MQNSPAPQEFIDRQPDTLIEAAEHDGVGNIGLGRRIEVKDLLDGQPPLSILPEGWRTIVLSRPNSGEPANLRSRRAVTLPF
jgi:hypothetical protein